MKEPIELEHLAGSHISSACKQAVEMANKRGRPVHFVFNDTHVTAQPGDKPTDLQAKWQADSDAERKRYLASPEYKASCEKHEAEEKQKRECHHIVQGKTEEELRSEKAPWPYTKEQLTEYIESLVHLNHDYGTCVYAMSMAAEAAYNYVAHCLEVSGFQASCADLDFLRRTRSMKGPFIILKAEDGLYPQSDLQEKLDKFLVEVSPWLNDEAKKKLAETERAHPDVVAHWKMLAQEVAQ